MAFLLIMEIIIIFDETGNTNDWIKVTKNSGDHNFTIEFEVIIDGKPLKGQYTGPFVAGDINIWT